MKEKIEAIEARNQRVELDKAWETSRTRRLSIAVITYVVVVAYLFVIGNDRPLINGLVPLAGFLLSTLVLPQIKAVWVKYRR